MIWKNGNYSQQHRTIARTEAGEAEHLQTTHPNPVLPLEKIHTNYSSQNNNNPAIITRNSLKMSNQKEKGKMTDLSIAHCKTVQESQLDISKTVNKGNEGLTWSKILW